MTLTTNLVEYAQLFAKYQPQVIEAEVETIKKRSHYEVRSLWL